MAKIPIKVYSFNRPKKTFIGKDKLKGETSYSREELIKKQREERELKKTKK